MKVRRFVTALLAAAAFGATGIAVPDAADAATVFCRAAMADSTPSPATRPALKVTTLAGASVSAVTHFRQGDLASTATAGSTGAARMSLSPKGLPGLRVSVDVRVRKGTSAATCRTTFTPGGVPGSVIKPVPASPRPGGAGTSAGAAQVAGGARTAVIDPSGGVVDMRFDCYSGDHSIQYGAITNYAPYYRSYRLWTYVYATDQWVAMTDWTPAFIGTNNSAYRTYPGVDGWYGGYVEVAVWTDFGGSQEWVIYGDYANHTQQGWAGSGSYASAYPQRACYASW